MFDLGRFLPYHINRTGVRLANAFGAELARYDLSVPMWRILAALWRDGERRATELMVDTSLEQSTLSRLLSAMEGRGLLTRRRSRDDARAVVVRLTAEGRRLTRELIPYALRNERIALRGFSADEIDTLLGMLARIYDNAADLKL